MDNNVSKILWVSIAIGIISIFGFSIIKIYPKMIKTINPNIEILVAKTLETPAKIKDNTYNMTKTTNAYSKYWDFLSVSLADTTDYHEIKPNTWSVVDFDFKINNHTNSDNVVYLDISTATNDENINKKYNYDLDYVPNRKFKWTDSHNIELKNNIKAGMAYVENIKNNKQYHIQYAYYNNKTTSLFQNEKINGTYSVNRLGIHPTTGIKNNTSIDIEISNYKIYTK